MSPQSFLVYCLNHLKPFHNLIPFVLLAQSVDATCEVALGDHIDFRKDLLKRNLPFVNFKKNLLKNCQVPIFNFQLILFPYSVYQVHNVFFHKGRFTFPKENLFELFQREYI